MTDHDHDAAVESFGICPHCETLVGVPGPLAEPALSPEEAKAVRDEAIARVDVHADEQWRIAALESVLACSIGLAEFTADDVWERLETNHPGIGTHEPAALGPVFLEAARRDWIAKQGSARPSRYGRRHRDLTVWRSLLLGTAADG